MRSDDLFVGTHGVNDFLGEAVFLQDFIGVLADAAQGDSLTLFVALEVEGRTNDGVGDAIAPGDFLEVVVGPGLFVLGHVFEVLQAGVDQVGLAEDVLPFVRGLFLHLGTHLHGQVIDVVAVRQGFFILTAGVVDFFFHAQGFAVAGEVLLIADAHQRQPFAVLAHIVIDHGAAGTVYVLGEVVVVGGLCAHDGLCVDPHTGAKEGVGDQGALAG